ELPGITAATEPTLSGDAEGVRAVAGTPGSGVDAEAVADNLVDAADAADELPIVVDTPLVPIPPVATDAEADAAAADAEAATATPLTVVVGSVERPLEVATMRSW